MNYNPEGIEQLIRECFPGKFANNYESKVEINPQIVTPFASLVANNLGDFYRSINGDDWLDAKIDEMQEKGLVYVTYLDKNEIIGFISFVDTWDDQDKRVLYLYEIQINPKYQNKGLGKSLIQSFHNLALKISENDIRYYNTRCATGNSTGIYLDHSTKDSEKLAGTKLTVFSENKVVNWYYKLGYILSQDSPRDRQLRSGKIIKPDYYLMIRKV